MKRTVLVMIVWGCSSMEMAGQRPLADYAGPAAYSNTITDAISFTDNQAALAALPRFSGTIYMERRFLLTALSNYTVAAGMPSVHGNIGFVMQYNGFSEYNQTQFGAVYAKRLGSKASIGGQINFHNLNIAGYGRASTLTAEVGVIWHLSEQLHTGMQIKNPVGGKFGNNGEEKIPSVYVFGCGYEPGNKFFTGIEIINEEDRPPNVNVLLQYHFIPACMIVAGISSATSSGWMGVKFYWKTFHIGTTASYHNQLGITPGLLIGITSNNKAK
jgi:hypothetical protein